MRDYGSKITTSKTRHVPTMPSALVLLVPNVATGAPLCVWVLVSDLQPQGQGTAQSSSTPPAGTVFSFHTAAEQGKEFRLKLLVFPGT